MRSNAALVVYITISLLFISIAGCTTSVVRENHPLYTTNTESSVTIYFLRPRDQRSRGIVDRDIDVVLNDQVAVSLSVGEYAGVQIKPGKTEVMLRNMTYIASRPQPEEVWRSFRTVFEAGKTYYVLAKMEMEEFRGVYFMPSLIERNDLSGYQSFLKPAGDFAKANPLY